MTEQAERFRQIMSGPDEDVDLAEAALLIACEEYRDLDVAAYLARLDELASNFRRRLRADISTADTIIALNRFLFDECGFSGNTVDYYDPRNSFLNDVIDRRCGVPITLALVYLEIGHRVGLPVQGVSFPAHFLVRCPLREGMVVLDPYARGLSLSLDDLKQRVAQLRNGVEPRQAEVAGMLGAASNKEILARMLRNLKQIYVNRKQWQKALATSDRMLDVIPELAEEYRDRGMMYFELECFRAALSDLQVYLEMVPDARDADIVRRTVVDLQAMSARLN